MGNERITNAGVADLARHIPVDYGARNVVGITDDDWFVVGPNCLELWWQFKGPRYFKFMDPYVKKVLLDVKP